MFVVTFLSFSMPIPSLEGVVVSYHHLSHHLTIASPTASRLHYSRVSQEMREEIDHISCDLKDSSKIY